MPFIETGYTLAFLYRFVRSLIFYDLKSSAYIYSFQIAPLRDFFSMTQ